MDHSENLPSNCKTVEKGGAMGMPASPPIPPPFPGANMFFLVKSEKIKPLHVSNMWDFSLLIEQDISDKK